MPDAPEQTGQKGKSPAVEISNAAVHIVREYTGRGPTKAKTTINHEVIVIVMRDTMLKAEKTLAHNGDAQLVLDMRHRFQATMQDDLVAAVERISGRRVLAFMSGNHIDPDMAVEIFVLAPDGADGKART